MVAKKVHKLIIMYPIIKPDLISLYFTEPKKQGRNFVLLLKFDSFLILKVIILI
jgi:hypothetical protein